MYDLTRTTESQSVSDSLVQPYNSMPYFQLRLIILLYFQSLIFSEIFDFLTISQFNSFVFRSIVCSFLDSIVSNSFIVKVQMQGNS